MRVLQTPFGVHWGPYSQNVSTLILQQNNWWLIINTFILTALIDLFTYLELNLCNQM